MPIHVPAPVPIPIPTPTPIPTPVAIQTPAQNSIPIYICNPILFLFLFGNMIFPAGSPHYPYSSSCLSVSSHLLPNLSFDFHCPYMLCVCQIKVIEITRWSWWSQK